MERHLSEKTLKNLYGKMLNSIYLLIWRQYTAANVASLFLRGTYWYMITVIITMTIIRIDID